MYVQYVAVNMVILFAFSFGLKPFLMTPLLNAQTDAENQYNIAHKRTRSVIERCFGLTKERFRCLHKSGGAITYSPEKCCKIVMACLILHNMCVEANVPVDDESGNEDESDDDDHEDENDAVNDGDDDDDVVRCPHQPPGPNPRAMRRDGVRVRQQLIQRFTR